MKLLRMRLFLFSLLGLLLISTLDASNLSAAPFSDRGFGWNPGTDYRNTASPYDRDAGYQNFDGYNSYHSPYYYSPNNYNDWRSNRNYAPIDPYNGGSTDNPYLGW